MSIVTGGVTEDQTPEQQTAHFRPRPLLFVVMHCDNPSLGGARYELSGLDLVEFGRGDGRSASRTVADGLHKLCLTLPGTTVSRSHGRLVHKGDSWRLEDTGSRNGCFVNGARVTSTILQDGDDLLIGDVLLRYRSALRMPSTVQPDLDSETCGTTLPGFFTLVPAHEAKLADLARIAHLPITTLLIGHSGTGKEVLANGIHALSGRSGMFVAVNCGALTPTLLESQLFGHVKGAFTGAARDELGYIRQADGGTLFLDEIGDLPLPAQSALLRVLQECEVVPVGGTLPVKVAVRVLTATHKPLDKMVARGEFRGDLWARLNGYRHELAPLAERIEDLGILTRDLLRRSKVPDANEIRFSTQAARAMLQYPWPYNIRELSQALDVAAALADKSVIARSNLPMGGHKSPCLGPEDDETRSPDLLRQKLISLLEKHRGNVSLVAKDLDKARTQVHRWLQRFAIRPEDYRT